MPDFWTHIIGGEKVVEKMLDEFPLQSRNLISYIEENRKLFNFACQGPDFFFYNDFWPWIKSKRGQYTGKVIQLKNVKDFLIESLVYLKNHQEASLFNYIAGFFCHYSFDKNLHPFIKEKTTQSSDHKKIEILIDCYFVKYIWNKKTCDLLANRAIDFADHLPKIIIDYYQTLLQRVHNISGVNYIDGSYRDMKKFFPIFFKPGIFKKGCMGLVNLLIKEDLSSLTYPPTPDFRILSKQEWSRINDSFTQAVTDGVNYLKLALDFLTEKMSQEKLSLALPEKNFEGEYY